MAAPYFSELKFLGNGNVDFLEVVVDGGTDVSNIQVVVYNPSGTVRTTNALGPLVATIAGDDVYVIDQASSATFNGVHKNGAVALVVDGTVTAFYSFDATLVATGGPAAGMTTTQLGSTAAGESLESTDGVNFSIQTSPNSGVIPCFVSGTLIETATGYRPIEGLQAGDLVLTRDHGLQPILWHGKRQIHPDTDQDHDWRPVRIGAGAIAPGLPARDLYLSPNHKVLLWDALCEMLFSDPELLVPAKSLCGRQGIHRVNNCQGVHYHHLLFEQHQIIRAEGLETESFHPARVGYGCFDEETRDELHALFPMLRHLSRQYGPSARPVLRPYEAQVLIQSLLPAADAAQTCAMRCAA